MFAYISDKYKNDNRNNHKNAKKFQRDRENNRKNIVIPSGNDGVNPGNYNYERKRL